MKAPSAPLRRLFRLLVNREALLPGTFPVRFLPV